MKVVVLKKTALILTSFVLVCLLAFGLNYVGVPVGAVNAHVGKRKLPIYAVATAENKVAISFDAAWGADKTSEIMNICDSYNVKATFFLVGFWIEKYPEKVKEIYNRGFEVGLHSNTHPDMTKLTRNQIKQELSTNIKLIEDLTNYTPKLFRPPYGYYNNTLIDVCEELGLSCIQWSVDSLDWKGISASELAGRVTSKSKNGSIILCHNNSDNIIDGTKMMLHFFTDRGTKVVPVGELIYYNNFTIDSQGIQIKK